MNSLLTMRVAAVTFCAALAVPARLDAQEAKQGRQLPHYTVTSLGTLGGSFSEGNGINSRGAVSGTSLLPGMRQSAGFSWKRE